MSRSTEDLAEIPRWVRLLDGKRWFSGRGLSRRDVHIIEAFCLGCAIIVFAGSFLTTSSAAADALRTAGVLELACAYLVSANIRLRDKYKLWPGTAGASRPRTWRTRIAEYALLFAMGILGTAIFYWLAF